MRNLSLSQKMGFIVALLSFGIVAVASVGLYNLRKIGDVVAVVTDVQFKSVTEALKLKDAFHSQMIYERNFILFYHIPEKRANNAEQIRKLDDHIRQMVAERLKEADSEESKNLKSFLETYDVWVKNDQAVQTVMAESDGTAQALKLVSTVGRDTRLAGDKSLDEIGAYNQKHLDQEKLNTTSTIGSAQQIIGWTSFAAILIGVSLAVAALHNLTQAINRVLHHLGENSHQVGQAASQIANASESLSQTATEQASSLEETVATIEELTAMVQVNATNANAATQLADGTRKSAHAGEEKIRALLNAMKVIDQDSKKIQEITSVVDDIAFQTNLLALNASVEAARAGDQGKGFAVVAEAVRTLAQRSSEAAKDISNLINSSVERIEDGYQRAHESVSSLSEIVGAVQKVSNLNSEIATATSEQANGITQIGKAMNQLDAVTQGNAAASEQAAASSQELASQALVLNRVVGELRVAIKGSSAQDAA